jgi:hypothetical protein
VVEGSTEDQVDYDPRQFVGGAVDRRYSSVVWDAALFYERQQNTAPSADHTVEQVRFTGHNFGSGGVALVQMLLLVALGFW